MWIARDKDGTLCVYPYEKPKRITMSWIDSFERYFIIDKRKFPDLRWEDEPIEVELKPKGENEKYLNEVRNNAAIAAMQAAIARYTSGRYNEWLSDIRFSEIANFAVKCADYLIEELKNK